MSKVEAEVEREEEKKERKREGEVPKHEDAHLLLDRVQVHLPHEGDSAAADQHGAGAEQGLAPSRAEVKDTDGTRRKGLVRNGDSACHAGVPGCSWPFGSGVSLTTPASAETSADHRCPPPTDPPPGRKVGPRPLNAHS